jgi:cytochrome c553
MMRATSLSWRDIWFRRSVASLVALAVLCALVGFVWLPSRSEGFATQGLWASICRAAGVPSAWSGSADRTRPGKIATNVVLDRRMAAVGADDAIGRGATLALNCTMCHGSQGLSRSDAPNLAGQYPEVVVKQLHDYQSGKRASSIMQALASNLTDRDMADLAAYYGYLPKARNAPTTYDEPLPVLVRVGAPLRNIAPCISCHGSVDQKLGAPWLEGMPRQYLFDQLMNFHSGIRGNDSHAQMRNMVRAMTTVEMAEIAAYYAKGALPDAGR